MQEIQVINTLDIISMPISTIADEKAHLYLWCPNALLPDGLAVMDAWGFEYKGNIVWEKVRKECHGIALVWHQEEIRTEQNPCSCEVPGESHSNHEARAQPQTR